MTDDRIKLNEALLRAMRAANQLTSFHPYRSDIVLILSDLMDATRQDVRDRNSLLDALIMGWHKVRVHWPSRKTT